MELDYDNLINLIQLYANRKTGFIDIPTNEFDASIPFFITLGEQRILTELKDIGYETVTATGRLIPNFQIISKPGNWNKTLSFIYGEPGDVFASSTTLYLRTFEFCITYSQGLGKPQFYCDHQASVNEQNPSANADINQQTPYNAWWVSPRPDLDYSYQVTYLQTPIPLTSKNPINFLTQKFPNLLFYACFIEALSWLKDDERIPMFESLYNRALQAANNQTQERYTDRTSKRDKD